MIPRFCRVKHDPPHSYGDCVWACFATLLDDDNFPHAWHNGVEGEQAWQIIRDYLAITGRKLLLFAVDDLEQMRVDNPGVAYVLLCSNSNGDHAVVGIDDKVFHDPAWYRTPIKKHTLYNNWILAVVL